MRVAVHVTVIAPCLHEIAPIVAGSSTALISLHAAQQAQHGHALEYPLGLGPQHPAIGTLDGSSVTSINC